MDRPATRGYAVDVGPGNGDRLSAATSVFARAAPTVVLDVVPTEFGAERDRETGGDQIAEWQMSVGQQTFGDREFMRLRVSQAGKLNPLPFEGLPAKAPLPLACSGL